MLICLHVEFVKENSTSKLDKDINNSAKNKRKMLLLKQKENDRINDFFIIVHLYFKLLLSV